MKRSAYRYRQPTAPMWVRTAVWLLVVFFVFLALVAVFRRGGGRRVESEVRTSDTIVAELTEGVRAETPIKKETSRGIPESTSLSDVSGGPARAVAKRVVENGQFTHTILAQDLPAIDEVQLHYQGWLIQPYPFDFFATGKLVHNVDGSWGMVWSGRPGETYDGFTDVLITREPNHDFDENPSAEHVLEGAF